MNLSIKNFPELGALDTSHWPGRKRPVLTIVRGNWAETIAYFRDDAACDAFNAWLSTLLTLLNVPVKNESR